MDFFFPGRLLEMESIRRLLKERGLSIIEMEPIDPFLESESEESKKGVIFKMWGIAKDFTAKMAKRAFEKLRKFTDSFNPFLKRKYKTRDLGNEKQQRWWIELRGTSEEYEILKKMQPEIEHALSCRLEAKSG